MYLIGCPSGRARTRVTVLHSVVSGALRATWQEPARRVSAAASSSSFHNVSKVKSSDVPSLNTQAEPARPTAPAK